MIILLTVLFKVAFLGIIWLAILPWFRKSRRLSLLLFNLILLFVSFLAMEVWMFASSTDFTALHVIFHPSPIVWLNAVIYMSMIVLSLAVFFTRDWLQSQKEKQILIETKLRTELDFLKSQIHPHFLFNTLNNIFSIAQRDGAENVADSIARLSGLMRYMLYESGDAFVALDKEIEHLNDFIALAKMRYRDDEVSVEFKVSGTTKSAKLPPMILLPFVENAFKHGVVVGRRSEITISITASEDEIEFRCSNPLIARQFHGESSGLGLRNVARRIELLYPERHSLKIDHSTDSYAVMLTLRVR